MHSDFNVILELDHYGKTFKTPKFASFFSNQTQAINAMEKFFLVKFENYGLPVVKEPCELLDLVEQIPRDLVPMYQFLVIDMANIHMNPNRNSKDLWNPNRTTELDQMFELVNNVVGIYKQHIKGKLNSLPLITFNGRTSKESRLQSMLNNLKGLLQKAQSTLEDASSGIKGTFVGLFSNIDPGKYKTLVKEGILILDEFNKTVFQKPLSKKILTRIDATTAKIFEASKGVGKDVIDVFQDLSKHIASQFKNNTVYDPVFDPLKNYFNEEQLKCRGATKTVMDFFDVPSLKNYVKNQTNLFQFKASPLIVNI